MGVSISMLSFDADQSQKGQPAAHIHMFTVTFASLF